MAEHVFQFSLDRVALCTPDPPPDDLLEVIGSTGDQFRDWFTRLCLYLVLDGQKERERSGDSVVIGSEYNNTEALARLQRKATGDEGKLLSAQHFPSATSGSASAFVSMGLGATGRNMTLNAGALTPVLALLQALTPLASGQSRTSHLLVGDVYTPESAKDAQQGDPGVSVRSGVAHARLVAGEEFAAEFRFESAGDSGEDRPEPNSAFRTADFLRSVQELPPGGHAVLDCRSASGRRAVATVTRRPS